jgi:hypothetical protein
MDKLFTRWKFEVIKTLMADGEISHAAFRVGICILQHINSKTKIARLSDGTIHDKIGGLSVRRIIEARNELKDQGWIVWHRPNRLKENYYRFIGTKMNAILDEQTAKTDMRKERWSRRGTIIDMSETACPDPMRHDESDMSGRDESSGSRHVGNDSYTPMKDYTLNGTPKERGPTAKKVLVVEGERHLHIIGTTLGTC